MKFVLMCGLLLVFVHAEIKAIYDFPEWWTSRDIKPDPWNQSHRDMRIIGGQEAEVNQFPYQVGLVLYLKNSTDVGLCGGALITTERVLTAAHCVDIVIGIDAIFGAHSLIRLEDDQVRRKVPTSEMVWHEGYDPKILTNDIAIIRISTPVPLSKAIQVVALPQTADLESDFVGELGAVSGWGLFSSIQSISKFLRFIDVTVITNSECRLRFPTRIQNSTSKLLLLKFCGNSDKILRKFALQDQVPVETTLAFVKATLVAR